MADPNLLTSVVSNLTLKSWEVSCIAILNSSDFDWTHGLVNESGLPVKGLTSATWGITLETCQEYCGVSAIPFAINFDFQSFSGSMTNYLLPWLALTAQLPFETGDAWANIVSFCLAVGSPALATYSLTITILNRQWVQKEFNQLRSDAWSLSRQKRYSELGDRVETALFLLQEAQQVPLRASQAKGWFSSLLVLPDNTPWWEHLHERLTDTRRGITASLVAQMLFAALTYLFTVITSFDADLGDPATALQIASGSLWIWLIPVISGWITVGTQASSDSVERALKKEAFRALEPYAVNPQDAADTGTEPSRSNSAQHTERDKSQTIVHIEKQPSPLTEESEQLGLVVGHGLTPQPHGLGVFDTPARQALHPPSWLGADVRGDERQKGPMYNYARLFTWWQLADTTKRGLDETLQHVKEGYTCAGLVDRTPAWQKDKPADVNLAGDSLQVARYCGLAGAERKPILAYPHWRPDTRAHPASHSPNTTMYHSLSSTRPGPALPASVYQRIIAASFAAIFVQWGTSGASVVIAYLTPTVGLGCRSGSYILYAGLGTLVWLLLLISQLLSHEIMLQYQTVHVRVPSTGFQEPELGGFWNGVLRGTAVATRYLGKLLAILNTLWLVLSSLLEFIGGYDNCWCKADVLGLRSRGWVVLFKDAADLAVEAELPWGLGLAMALLVCTLSYTFFALGTWNMGGR